MRHISLVVCAVVLFIGCSKPKGKSESAENKNTPSSNAKDKNASAPAEKPSFIGNWALAKSGEKGLTASMVIKADGTLTSTSKSPGSSGTTYSVKWKKVSDKKISVPDQKYETATEEIQIEAFTIDWIDANSIQITDGLKFVRKK